MSALIKKNIETQERDKPNFGLDVKEVGFMLRLIEDNVHQGKFLELALQVKLKLQGKMETLMKNKEVM